MSNYKYSFFDSFNAPQVLGVQVAPAADVSSVPTLTSYNAPTGATAPAPAAYQAYTITGVQNAQTNARYLSQEMKTQIKTIARENALVVAVDTPQKANLEVKGQGTVSVKADSNVGFHIALKTEDAQLPNLYLDVTRDMCSFSYGGLPTLDGGALSSTSRQPIPDELLEYPKGKDVACLHANQGPYKHWLSIDRQHGVLRYGRGYCTASLVLLQAVFKKKEDTNFVYVDKKWEWLPRLQHVEVKQTGGQEIAEMIVDRFPLVRDLSPYIVKDEGVTLDDLETGAVTVVANLPQACQVLYKNVAGPKITLDTDDFPFSEAIERSVRTEGLLGHTLLTKKAGAHGNFLSTYLRITIGTNLGNSPGIPYVLEIWPAGHSSPIHDHGHAFAVIKVLCGQINAYYFDSLEAPGPNPIGNAATFKKDDVTWLSSNNYQIHQLKNEFQRLCCTIQCYQYGSEDKAHYEGFRFVKAGQHSALPGDEPFLPGSDMAFGEFRKAIKDEWDAYQLQLKEAKKSANQKV